MVPEQPQPDLSRVVVAVSAFRSDNELLALLGRIFAREEPGFAAVIVVDSLGSGRLEAEIHRAGWRVTYENAQHNLGSAGNLARRLELAAEEEADWCFAINHDGVFDREMIALMVARGQSAPRVGAVFPRRTFADRGGVSSRPHQSVFKMPKFDAEASAGEAPEEVAWDSSNGALYALQPIREGLRPWADFWMGWEDLAYGWVLSHNGWKQLHCETVEFPDNYEYQRIQMLGRSFYIARKPAWYAYYLRNLVLFTKRSGGGVQGWRLLLSRYGREFAFTLLFRTEKRHRLKLLLQGFADGLSSKAGKGPVP